MLPSAGREIVLGDPAQKLEDITAVAANRQSTSVLAGKVGQELLHGLLKKVICSFHGFTVANPAITGQTRNPVKYGSYNAGFSPLYGIGVCCVNGDNHNMRYVEHRLSEPWVGEREEL